MTNTPDPKPTKPTGDPARQPIAVDRLLITHTNPHGVKMPEGPEGRGEKMQHSLKSSTEGDIKTEIEFRPWMRAFRVKRTQRVTHTENGKEVATWKAMGKPFYIHETWAVWVPVEEG